MDDPTARVRLAAWWRERRRRAALRREYSAWAAEHLDCPTCDGLGTVEAFVDPLYAVLGEVGCRACGGTGLVAAARRGEVDVPARFLEVLTWDA